MITLTSHTTTVLRNQRLLTELKFACDVTSCQFKKQLSSLTTGFLRWTLRNQSLMVLASFIYIWYLHFLFLSNLSIHCSMWWTVDPDGFWVKAMQMLSKSVLPPISPLSHGANTGRLPSLSLLPQTHLPPPCQPPPIPRVSMLPLLQGQVGFRRKKKRARRFLFLLWKCQIL